MANGERDYLAACELCPRRCRSNRRAGERGYCRAGDQVEIYRFGAHHGEEPPVSGQRGSGTVFFSRCTMRCLYCQNYPWSQEGKGDTYSAAEVAGVFESLERSGCHNWNLVSPTPWLPLIREALAEARSSGRSLPVVYNTSGFENDATLREFEDVADVYLADLRYARTETAKIASGAATYPEVARKALRTMWELKGPLRVDEAGLAQSGVICRILILPGYANEAIANLEWLAETFGTDFSVSVMAQYHPAYRAQEAPWNRRVTREEYGQVVEAVQRLELVNGWVQDLDESTPDNLLGFMMKAGEQ